MATVFAGGEGDGGRAEGRSLGGRNAKHPYKDLVLIVNQANALAPNWGQTIFQSANEIAANTMFRKRLDDIQAQTQAEKEWWEKRRTSIETDFLKELDEEAAVAPVKPI